MDKEKIDEIYRENAAMIYKYLCGLTQDSGLAEELTQETFFQAIKGIDKFRGDSKISVWLCGIAKKIWYKELEKRSRHKIAAILGKTENWARVTYYRGKQKIMKGMREWN